jgi:hypothetical protein
MKFDAVTNEMFHRNAKSVRAQADGVGVQPSHVSFCPRAIENFHDLCVSAREFSDLAVQSGRPEAKPREE